jgi:hypothetical protein
MGGMIMVGCDGSDVMGSDIMGRMWKEGRKEGRTEGLKERCEERKEGNKGR